MFNPSKFLSSARPKNGEPSRLTLAISAVTMAVAALAGIGVVTAGGGQPAPPGLLAAGHAPAQPPIAAHWPLDGRAGAAHQGGRAGAASAAWIPALEGTGTPARQPRPAIPSRAHPKRAAATTEGSGRLRHQAASGQQRRQAPSPCPGSSLQRWICQADQALIQHGTPRSALSMSAAYIVVEHESGGNPRAYNGWDSNAAAGHPSEGIAQVITPTFQAYALPGHADIWNPVDNMIAAFRYAISRYGSMNNIPGVVAVRQGGSYIGY